MERLDTASTRKIPEWEWDFFKDEIQVLYLTDNLTRDQIMLWMKGKYNFHASKAQYIRQLKKWGFTKNTTGEDWKFIARRIDKRKAKGTDSEIYVNGALISNKRLKKEISRHVLPSIMWTRSPAKAQSPQTPAGIRIRTPLPHSMIVPSSTSVFVETHNLPWFKLKGAIEMQCELYQAQVRPSYFINGIQKGAKILPVIPLWPDIGNPFLESGSQPSSEKMLSLLAKGLGGNLVTTNTDLIPSVIKRLEPVFIEGYEGELSGLILSVFAAPRFDTSNHFLGLCVYLSSNNLMSKSQTDTILKHVLQNGQLWILGLLLDMRTPTIEVFALNLLLSATRLAHFGVIGLLAEKKIDLNARTGDDFRRTALMEAVSMRNVPLVQFLLSIGADPNALSDSGIGEKSALQEAAKGKNSFELAKILLDAGAHPEGFEEVFEDNTPLQTAAKNNDLKLAELLLVAGAAVNRFTLECGTALQAASRNGNTDIIQLLLDEGAEVNGPSYDDFEEELEEAIAEGREVDLYRAFLTPIQLAAANGSLDAVNLLLEEGADVNQYLALGQDDWSEESIIMEYDLWIEIGTPLQNAVKSGCIETVGTLLKAGANVDGRALGKYGDTPLQAASRRAETVDFVHTLLNHGADINALPSEIEGITVVQGAAITGNIDLMRTLIAAGGDINHPASRELGRTAIQAAAQCGDLELVNLLIANGADVNAAAAEESGRTALQAAVEKGDVDLVQLLIAAGADVNGSAGASEGVTALQAAAMSVNVRMMDLLLRAGAYVNAPAAADWGRTALQAAASSGNVSGCRMLLEAGADINSPAAHRYGYTALQVATKENNVELVQLFLQNGADPNAPGSFEDGLTALEFACYGWEFNIAVLQLLVEGGVNVNHRSDPPKSTALQIASLVGAIDAIQILLSAGAEINAPASTTSYGTVLQQAVGSGNVALVQCLIDAGADVNGLPGQNYGRTALQHAALRGDMQLLRLLLDEGAEVNAPAATHRGMTALQAAAIKGHLRIALVLLEAGADVHAPPAEEGGRTVLEGAAEHGRLDMLQLLLNCWRQDHTLKSACEEAAKRAERQGRAVIAKFLREYEKN